MITSSSCEGNTIESNKMPVILDAQREKVYSSMRENWQIQRLLL